MFLTPDTLSNCILTGWGVVMHNIFCKTPFTAEISRFPPIIREHLLLLHNCVFNKAKYSILCFPTHKFSAGRLWFQYVIQYDKLNKGKTVFYLPGKPRKPCGSNCDSGVIFPQVMRDPIIWAACGKNAAAEGAEIKGLVAIYGTFCEKIILRPEGITLEIEMNHHAAVITFHLST